MTKRKCNNFKNDKVDNLIDKLTEGIYNNQVLFLENQRVAPMKPLRSFN